MAHSLEFTRKLTLTDPAVPATLGPEYRYPEVRTKWRRRPSVLRLAAGALTGAGASLTFQLEEEVAGAWIALGTTVVVTASSPNEQRVVHVSAAATGLRLRLTAKAGTTPALAEVDANLVSP